jgi:phosphotriesterase-related protein
MTVLGPVPAAELGVTLPHEHVLNANPSAFTSRPAAQRRADPIAHLRVAELDAAQRARLDLDPYRNLDNCSLDDPVIATEELAAFRRAGGSTVVDQTVDGIGRSPRALAQVSKDSGVHIVMGCGYYLERSHPGAITGLDPDALTEALVAEIQDGVDGVRPGLIGEIGVSIDFTPRERAVLTAAGTAGYRTGLALSVHLPGWQRRGEAVLDIVEATGADLSRVAVSHMNPAGDDLPYLRRLAARGVLLSFDMLGMTFDFPGEGVCPTDEQTALAVLALLSEGLGQQVLLSHDTFLKQMWSTYGGHGYTHVLTSFIPRLRDLGVSDEHIVTLTTANPARFLAVGAPAPSLS